MLKRYVGSRAKYVERHYGMNARGQNRSEWKATEFRNLYGEIAHHSDRIESIIQSAIVGTVTFHGVILSLIFVKGGVGEAGGIVPGFFFLPLLFIFPSVVLVASHLNSTVRAASYIQVFFEERLPQGDVGWQTHLQMVREDQASKMAMAPQVSRAGRFLGWAIVAVFLGLSGFCIIPALLTMLYFEYMKQPLESALVQGYLWAAGALVTVSVVLALFCRLVWSTEAFERYIKRWQNIRDRRAGPAEGLEANPHHASNDAGTSMSSSNDPIIADWERVRREIEHEDVLINHRITWLLQTNAMLLAAFAGVYLIRSRILEGAKDLPQPSQEKVVVSIGLLLVVLIAFGMLVSFIILRSVKMANAQIESLVGWWEKKIEAHDHNLHPPLVGKQEGVVGKCLRWGYVIPMAFFVLWFGIGFSAFYDFVTTVAPNLTHDWIYGGIICILLIALVRQTLR